MAVFAWAAGDPFSYRMDEQPFYDAVSEVISSDLYDFATGAFVTVAHGRKYTQRKSFDFGWWYMRFVVPSAAERAEREYGELAGLIVGTIGLAAGWSPLFATTLMAYTNPYTAAVAFPLDAYNIYRYLV